MSPSAPTAPSRRVLVLDDDPTGSQCVAGVDVVLTPEGATIAQALREPGSTCFVLTNTRALDEADAVAVNRRVLEDVIAAGVDPRGLHVVSRSDSTLRGHVITEPSALADVLAAHDRDVDGILFCPAMIEAGRLTEGGIHRARIDGELVEVASTPFAADATFGYSRSDLAGFLEERSGGAVRAGDVLQVGLEDIRDGGVDRVTEILAAARERQWIAVDAVEYEDMEVVVAALARVEEQGHVLLTRCAPSFVRPLAGQHGAQVLAAEDVPGDPSRSDHGLVVVGSHVPLTTRQLERLRGRGGIEELELEVPRLLDADSRRRHLDEVVAGAREALERSEVVVSTSRDLVRNDSPDESLAIARSVSDAVVEVVQQLRSSRPSWVVAKGGITSHEVAASGLQIRRAEVAGQFFPGQISLFDPIDAPEEVLGTPYVVFPGNVGGDDALAEVVEVLARAQAASAPASIPNPATPDTTAPDTTARGDHDE
ncbi:hypothetical protein DEO23_00185 [Brachybacterium endophyticum]|uniref:Four-carbon acid sugar kinase family protein n=1 Tax=Brachybacterium endophyticum TaxID=2182385 RepID=A0A2U2RMM9_9MICO|nr:four-carbon acid sugar kinase family protein [Brachybacterium endophyticum]PWH07123.1 hypothetical protein DEO23_00185 [Brachybacterium endophyticum]